MKLDELEGGKAVLQRILDAYGFTMQKQHPRGKNYAEPKC